MNLQFIRHATFGMEYAGVRFLVDPMLSDAGVNPPIPNSSNDRRNPLVGLPGEIKDWLTPDALLVTHLHRDHWDEAAAALLAKSTPILCQPGDEHAFLSAGFEQAIPVAEPQSYQGIRITRTGGRHGTGEIGVKMGPVSGFVLQAKNLPTIYIAGDTIWCEEVAAALDAFRPDVTVVNAGGARFITGDPITMDAQDVVQVCRHAPYTKVVAVHMDAINHCLVTRQELQSRLAAAELQDQVLLPADGDLLQL